ncbi:MAG: hypothetical protein ACOCSL_04255, partial [Thermoplasmatota archaeon]
MSNFKGSMWYFNKKIEISLILFLWLVYIMLVLLFNTYEGLLMLILLPTVITGLFFGSKWGLLSGIFGVFL